jgi:arsenate reductase-like glutaredoxin family protein
MIVYGIPTCDTVRKALAALRAAGHDPAFRDVRADPLTAAERAEFLAAFGEGVVNRASTTWRTLSEEDRARDADALLAAHPALMKRPVIRAGTALHLGWGKPVQAALL